MYIALASVGLRVEILRKKRSVHVPQNSHSQSFETRNLFVIYGIITVLSPEQWALDRELLELIATTRAEMRAIRAKYSARSMRHDAGSGGGYKRPRLSVNQLRPPGKYGYGRMAIGGSGRHRALAEREE